MLEYTKQISILSFPGTATIWLLCRQRVHSTSIGCFIIAKTWLGNIYRYGIYSYMMRLFTEQ